ncbi:EamA family transporter [Patescibacteria group bacterium]|nr:EamA family transporter [Patescibacteria group bacterium]
MIASYPLLAILLGTFLLAVYNNFSKISLAKLKSPASHTMTALHLILGGVILIVFALLQPNVFHWEEGFWSAILITGALNILIMFARMKARELSDLSLVASIDSTTPFFVLINGMIFLREYPSKQGVIGILLLVLGMLIIGYGSKMIQKNTKGLYWALCAALVSSVSLLFDGLIARKGTIALGLGCVFLFAGIGNALLAYRFERISWSKISSVFSMSLICALLIAVANITIAYTYRYLPIAYVGSLKRLQIPFTIILAYIFLNEKENLKSRLLGGTVMALGSTLL